MFLWTEKLSTVCRKLLHIHYRENVLYTETCGFVISVERNNKALLNVCVKISVSSPYLKLV